MKRTSRLRRWSALLIAAASLLALSACTSSRPSADTPTEVRIGLLGTLSGPGAAAGQEAARGAELAALVVNQNGSVPLPLAGSGLPHLGGAKLRIIQQDSFVPGPDPDQGAAPAAVKLTAQGVAGIVSVDSATRTALASERTERIGVPFVGAVSTADFLTGRGLDWFFRATPTDSMLAQAALGWLDQRSASPVRRLGVLTASDDTSNEAMTALGTQAAQAGGTFSSRAGFNTGSLPAQVRPSLDKARTRAPDAIVAVAAQQGHAHAVLAANAGSPNARQVTIAMGTGFTAQVIRQATQTGGTDVTHTAAWSLDFAQRNPAANAVAQLYQQRYKTAMTETAAETFTATLTLAQAIDAAGSVGAQQIRTALLGLDVPGRDTIMPWGGIRFDQTGQNTLASALVERVTQTSARVVFPRELGQAAT